MGARQTFSDYSFLYSQWLFVQRNQSYDVYRQLKNNQQVQVYSINLLTKQQIILYERRKIIKQINIVQLIHYQLFPQKQRYLCGGDAYGKIILQRTPYKIAQYKKFQKKTIQQFCQQIIKGFHYLYQNFGAFKVQQQMIHINTNGIVKVWMNQHFFLNHKSNSISVSEKAQKIMIESIFKFFKNLFFPSGQLKSCIDFLTAIDYFNGSQNFQSSSLSSHSYSSNMQNHIKHLSSDQQKIIEQNYIQKNSQKNISNQPTSFKNYVNRYQNQNFYNPNSRNINSTPNAHNLTLMQKKNASFTYTSATPKRYQSRPVSNIPEPNIQSYQFNQRKKINPNILQNKDVVVRQFQFQSAGTLNFSNGIDNYKVNRVSIMNLNNIPTQNGQDSLNRNQKHVNSFGYKKNNSNNINILQNKQQFNDIQKNQIPKLGLSPKIQIKIQDNSNKKHGVNSSYSYNNNHSPMNVTKQSLVVNIQSVDQLRKQFLNPKKNNFSKLQLIDQIMNSQSNQKLKKLCIIFKYALTIDQQMLDQLIRVNQKEGLVMRKQIKQRINNILNEININKKNEIQGEQKLILLDLNCEGINNRVKRIESNQDLSKINQLQNQLLNKKEQIINQDEKNIVQGQKKKHKRNKSQTQTLIPSFTDQFFQQNPNEKKNTCQIQKRKQSININKIDMKQKIKQILDHQRQKRLNKQKNKQFNQTKYDLKKNQKLFQNNHHLFQQKTNQQYNPINSTPLNINLNSNKYKQISFGKSNLQEKIQQIQKKTSNYQAAKTDIQRLLINTEYDQQSTIKIRQQNSAIEEKIKKKKNNFAKLKKQVAEVLGI